ncbi:MAG: pyrimidine-nucleoside phosphorylase [Thermotogaceae bacterium]|nr:pyrimidine-nucleoside phosphorylase [Thermotogaceae bacterium]
MRMVDLIQKKREGGALSQEEIEFLISEFVHGKIPDYQMSAFLMAVFFRHMTEKETFYLTRAMEHSGQVMDLSAIEGIKVDKHSTGGVGDKTTIILAPMVAACGVKVAKLSGRGLGHTGGTIDKLEAIPGFRTSLAFEEWVRQVNEIGLAVAGGNEQLVPADKKIYALRDVTATVEEISLIASSIMSKKLASGADAFVLDVKVGSGAFMKTLTDAQALAALMVKIATLSGKKACAFLTNMDLPLGKSVGNALEIIECVETLRGQGPRDLTDICLSLATKMVEYGADISEREAKNRVMERFRNGDALKKFKEFVQAQGGDTAFIDDPLKLIGTVNVRPFYALKGGWIKRMETEEIGKAAMILGAGRETKESRIDPAVGLVLEKKTGDAVKANEVLGSLYYREEKRMEEALGILTRAIKFDTEPAEAPKLILDVVA